MDGLDGIKARLTPKEFGNLTLYFDNDCRRVKIIESNAGNTFVVKRSNGDSTTFALRTELHNNKGCVEHAISLKDAWFIPQVEELVHAEKVEEGIVEDDIALLLSDYVFEITDYGALDNPKYFGSDFSNQVVTVTLENHTGRKYKVKYILGGYVRGGDEVYDGSIFGTAYPLCLLAKVDKKGNAVAI